MEHWDSTEEFKFLVQIFQQGNFLTISRQPKNNGEQLPLPLATTPVIKWIASL